jgi:hypothetical protein
MLRFGLLTLMAVLTGAAPSFGQNQTIEITVAGGKEDARNIPVVVPLEVVPALVKFLDKGGHVRLNKAGSNKLLFGQWTTPGLLTEEIQPKDKTLVRRDLHFVLPELKAGSTWISRVELSRSAATPGKLAFDWKEPNGAYVELWRGERPILRYMYRAYDNSSTAIRNKTYKVFHHVYDPTGKRIVTNGGDTDPGAENKKLLYPHHRGLMYAFNQISYDGMKGVDTWHAKPKDTHESHAGFLSADTGLVLGRHRVAIDWHGPDNKVFAKEEREMTVYNVPGGTLVEFASRLKTAGGKVHLDGDPQHAGFQFRAANDVSEKENAKQTYYLRPDGKGGFGETRNWDPKTKKGPVNLPWDAMSFVLDARRYTVAYVDHPKNPGEKRYSERDYGRFGCYFVYDLTPEHPLVLNHRIWLQDGEMTGDQVQALSTNFVSPPQVAVK